MDPKMKELMDDCESDSYYRVMIMIGVVECAKALKWISIALAVMAVCGLYQCSEYAGMLGPVG